MAALGKRKKAKPKNPNPLFCAWLEEWRNEADSNGWKSANSYGMALSSLKKYPLRLEKGIHCKILIHFGDKICGMLDKRLESHIATGGSVDAAVTDSDKEDKTPPRPRNKPSTSLAVLTDKLPADSAPMNSPPPKKKRSKSGGRPYVPVLRSGPYAILVTLYQYTQVDRGYEYLTKKDLTRLAQPLCDKSLTVPDTGSYYTAFSTMTTLITKGLVDKHNCPARYRLTNEGVILAQTLVSKSAAAATDVSSPGPSTSTSISSFSPATTATRSDPQPSADRSKAKAPKGHKAKAPKGHKAKSASSLAIQNDIQQSSTSNDQTPSCSLSDSSMLRGAVIPPLTVGASTAAPKFTLHPSDYEIILIVDNAEHYGFGNAKPHILPHLASNKVSFEVRPLSVGDFVWIVQERHGEKREAVLDYIVERKRLDDLAGSIVDGRYREQKLRMKNSRLRKLVYLVEYYQTQSNQKIKEDALHQAVMNTQIIDGFYVKRCDNLKDCIAYITLLHKQIVKMYQTKTVHVYSQELLPELPFNSCDVDMCHITYSDFNSAGVKSKPPSVTDCWRRMLMCVPGMSVEKAIKVVESYPTPKRLIESYRSCGSDSERIKLLSSIKSGATSRRLGDALSRTVYTLFYTAQPLS